MTINEIKSPVDSGPFRLLAVCLSFVLCIVLLIPSCENKDTAEEEVLTVRNSLSADKIPILQDDSAKKPNFQAAGLNGEEVRVFFEALKEAAVADDMQKLARMISYPCNTTSGTNTTKIESADGFISDYGEIWGDGVKKAIATQQFNDLFTNWRGVRVGKGQLWFAGVVGKEDAGGKEYTIKIIAINNF